MKNAKGILIMSESAVNAAGRVERGRIVRIDFINFFVLDERIFIVARFDIYIPERKKHVAVFGVVF